MSTLKDGDSVRFTGLVTQGAQYLNGKQGTVIGRRHDGGILVETAVGEVIPVTEANLIPNNGKQQASQRQGGTVRNGNTVGNYEPQDGDFVRLHNLVSNPRLNGKTGKVIGRRVDGGILVDIGSGEVIPVMPKNTQPVGDIQTTNQIHGVTTNQTHGGAAQERYWERKNRSSSGGGGVVPYDAPSESSYQPNTTRFPATTTVTQYNPGQQPQQQSATPVPYTTGYTTYQGATPSQVPMYQPVVIDRGEDDKYPVYDGVTYVGPAPPLAPIVVPSAGPVGPMSVIPYIQNGIETAPAITTRECELMINLGKLAQDNKRLQVELNAKDTSDMYRNRHVSSAIAHRPSAFLTMLEDDFARNQRVPQWKAVR